MNPTVTIIVPVYNAHKTINRCVDSILKQEFKDYELLLIDDGSTDDSGQICDQYAQQDLRVRVIHQENAGVSVARNRGLSEAAGTYIQFVDADDWISQDATRLMVRVALTHDCDMVITDFYRVINDRFAHKGDIDLSGVMSRETFAEYMMKNPADFYYGVLWNKLFKTDIIRSHQLSMDPRIRWCEDFMFNLEYIRYADVFYALTTPVYYYVRTKGSLVNQGLSLSKTIKMKRMVFSYYHDLYKNILDEETYEKNRFMVYLFLIDAAKDGIVPPAIFSANRKLGKERIHVSRTALAMEGITWDLYETRKVMEYYLRPAARKYDLTAEDIWLLFDAVHLPAPYTKKDLADVANRSTRSVNASLQHLSGRGIIAIEELPDEKKRQRKTQRTQEEAVVRKQENQKKEKRIIIRFEPDYEELLQDFAIAEEDYKKTVFDGFDEEEMELYENLAAKMDENIKRILL